MFLVASLSQLALTLENAMFLVASLLFQLAFTLENWTGLSPFISTA